MSVGEDPTSWVEEDSTVWKTIDDQRKSQMKKTKNFLKNLATWNLKGLKEMETQKYAILGKE